MATLYCAARAPTERGGRGLARYGASGRADRGGERAGARAAADPGDRGPAAGRLGAPGGGPRDRAGDRHGTGPQGGELVLISSNTGINLYLGNNPRYDATVGMRPGRDWQALVRAPRLHGVSGAGPASRFFVERVTAYAGRSPSGSSVSRSGSSGCCSAATEIPRNQEIYPARALVARSPGAALEGAGARVPVRSAPAAGGRRARRGLAAGTGPCRLGRPARAHRRRVLRHGALPRAPGPAARAVRGGGRSGGRSSRRARGRARSPALSRWPTYLLANLGQGPMPLRMNADAEQGLAHWLEREGRRPEALALYERLAHEAPDLVRRLVRRRPAGECSASRSRPAQALERIRGLEPEFLDTALLLARAAPRGRVRGRGGGLRPPRGGARRPERAGPTLLREAQALRAASPRGPSGGCPDRVFVVPFALAS